jgi:hypothetical protein
MSKVGFALELNGDISSFTPSVQAQMQSAVAARAGVDPSAVELDVLPGSVLVEVSIETYAATAALVESTMARALRSPSSATAVFVNVTGVSIVVLFVTPLTIADVPPPPPPSPSPPPPTSPIMTGASAVECELSGDFPFAGLAIQFFILLIPGMVTLQQSSDEFGGSQQSSVISFRNIGWVIFCCLDFVSDCGAAYLLRPTELCLGDGIIGGWQFKVQAYVVVVTTTIIMFFLAFPLYSDVAWASRPLLWPGLFALTLTGAIADIRARSVHTTMIYLVLVYVEEIPALVVKCNLLSHDLARGASTQWWVWISLALSLIGVVWRLGSILVRMCCPGDKDGEQGPQVRYPVVVGSPVKVYPHA